MYYCGRGTIATTTYLLKQGLDVDYIDQEGEFPLLLASWFGKLKMVEFLLDHGATIDLVNSRGESALSKAIDAGQTEVASLLQQRGATYTPDSTPSCPPRQSSTVSEEKGPASKQELSAVLDELLPLYDDWENIGLLLYVLEDELLHIKRSHPSDIERIHEIFNSWLKQTNPTWKKLMDAVEPIDP